MTHSDIDGEANPGDFTHHALATIYDGLFVIDTRYDGQDCVGVRSTGYDVRGERQAEVPNCGRTIVRSRHSDLPC